MNIIKANMKTMRVLSAILGVWAYGPLNAADALVWNATSGDWGVAANWLLGDANGNPTADAGHVPTGDDAVFFGPKWTSATTPYAITVGTDAEVTRFLVNRATVSVFDFAGKQMDVRSQLLVSNGADVTLTNGTVRYLNTTTSGVSNYHECNSATLRVAGAETAMLTRKGVSVKQTSAARPAAFHVSDGALLKGAIAVANNVAASDAATVVVRGRGTRVAPGAFGWDDETSVSGGGIYFEGVGATRLEVRDGAAVDMTDAHLAVVGATSNAVVVIDNAFFTNRHVSAVNREVKVGCQGGWNTLLVTNNAVFYTEMGINVANDAYKSIPEGSGPSNALVVADGGTVVLAANSSGDVCSLKVGAGHGDARLVLDGGRIKTPGSVVLGADTDVSNNVLVVRGTNSLLTAKDLELNYNAQMRYEIPQAGLVQAPVQVERHVCARYNYNLAWYGEAPSLTLSADAWIQKTGGKLTLLTCGVSDDRGLNKKVLEQLRDTGNADLARRGHDTTRTKLTVVEKANGTPALRLALSSPRMSGLLFILR